MQIGNTTNLLAGKQEVRPFIVVAKNLLHFSWPAISFDCWLGIDARNVVPIHYKYRIVVYQTMHVEGGSIVGQPIKRKILSNLAVYIARYSLKLCHIDDPVPGFFAFPRHVVDEVRFETNGFKFLLELLVKSRPDVRGVEIPYTFTNRKHGESKFDYDIIINYLNSIWTLYQHGRKSDKSGSQIKQAEKRRSVLFLSKAGRFFTVGASGLLINYVISYLLSNGVVSNIWYMQATLIGIVVQITSNFEDVDFSLRHVLRQYGTYLGFTSVGALIQLSLLYVLVESSHLNYGLSLLIAVAIASVSNFVMNKKWIFGENMGLEWRGHTFCVFTADSRPLLDGG